MDKGEIAGLVFLAPLLVLWWSLTLRLAWRIIRKGVSTW